MDFSKLKGQRTESCLDSILELRSFQRKGVLLIGGFGFQWLRFGCYTPVTRKTHTFFSKRSSMFKPEVHPCGYRARRTASVPEPETKGGLSGCPLGFSANRSKPKTQVKGWQSPGQWVLLLFPASSSLPWIWVDHFRPWLWRFCFSLSMSFVGRSARAWWFETSPFGPGVWRIPLGRRDVFGCRNPGTCRLYKHEFKLNVLKAIPISDQDGIRSLR